jgi:L-amino acid N-acyltransferase YncA
MTQEKKACLVTGASSGIGKGIEQYLQQDGGFHVIATGRRKDRLQAGIFPENESSIFLHKILGFNIVGVRQKIGKHNGVWRDVILMERRSNSIN